MTKREATKRTSQRQARAIGYVRVSRVGGRGGESFISPDVQRSTIEGLARAKGLELVDVIVDLDESGGSDDRPGFQQALELVERGKASVVIVARQDRFSRSTIDTHRAVERLEAAGGRLACGDLDVDTSTPTGRLVRNVMTSIAEFELAVKAEQWSTSQASAVDRGVKIASRRPFGYRFDESHRLELEPTEAPVVRALFELRAAGGSWNDLVEAYQEATGRRTAIQTMSALVRNRVYLGEVSFGELVKAEAHEAIVELDLFAEVERVNAARAGQGGRGHAGAPVSLLGGLARCSCCSRPLSRHAKGDRRARYECKSPRSQCAEAGSVLEDELDAYVWTRVLEWAGDAADEVVELPADLEASGKRLIAEDDLAKVKAGRLAFERDVELELEIGREAYQAKRESWLELEERRQAELDAIAEASELEVVRTTVREADESGELELEDKRELVRFAIDRLVVRRAPRGTPVSERVELTFADETSTPELESATEELEPSAAV